MADSVNDRNRKFYDAKSDYGKNRASRRVNANNRAKESRAIRAKLGQLTRQAD